MSLTSGLGLGDAAVCRGGGEGGCSGMPREGRSGWCDEGGDRHGAAAGCWRGGLANDVHAVVTGLGGHPWATNHA
jgi:hypothetical protein